MIENSYYSQEVQGPYEVHDIGNLELEEGGTIRGCKLAYAAFGRLNGVKDNAILIPTWYAGTSKIIEQVYIGPGRALDPDKYFIIVVNQIGNGLCTSPHNTPPPAGMANFRVCALATMSGRSTEHARCPRAFARCPRPTCSRRRQLKYAR
jgi:homoserine O-acetyltransferase